jgi:predicted nucleic acid-binding protein
LTLRQRAKLIAPELLIAECANILWKKVRLDELSKAEALTAAPLLQAADIELLPMQILFEATTRMSIEIDNPAYGCIYVVMAVENKCQFVTADQRLLRKLAQNRTLRKSAISLIEVIKPKD